MPALRVKLTSLFVLALALCFWAATPRGYAQTYVLNDDSDYISGCVGLCLCPTFLFPDVTGAFELNPAGVDGNFEVYTISDLVVTVGQVPNSFLITGEGTYRINLSQVPPLQQLDLEINVDGQIYELTSGVVEAEVAFPNIAVTATFDNGCLLNGLALSAEPVPDLDLPYLRGDANGDGAVSGLVDGLAILTFQFGGGAAPPCLSAADTDGNGAFSGLLDALYVLNFAFVPQSPPPPAPYPQCGLGDVSLGCDTPLVCP